MNWAAARRKVGEVKLGSSLPEMGGERIGEETVGGCVEDAFGECGGRCQRELGGGRRRFAAACADVMLDEGAAGGAFPKLHRRGVARIDFKEPKLAVAMDIVDADEAD